MGEKKLKRFVTYKDLMEIYGLTEGFCHKNSRLFRPALLLVNGRAPRPHRFDIDIIDQIITTGADSKPAKRGRPQRRKFIRRVQDDGDDLWR